MVFVFSKIAEVRPGLGNRSILPQELSQPMEAQLLILRHSLEPLQGFPGEANSMDFFLHLREYTLIKGSLKAESTLYLKTGYDIPGRGG